MQAVAYWKTLPSDEGAHYDKIVVLNAAEIVPQVSWGTNPEAVVPITGEVPDPAAEPDEARRAQLEQMLRLHGPQARPEARGHEDRCRLHRLLHQFAHRGSCAPPPPSRKGRQVAPGVRALVVPGSGLVKAQAEEEGLARSSSMPGLNGARPAARCAWA